MTDADDPLYCAKHRRRCCSKNRKNGDRCHQQAVAGIDACLMHCGQKREVAKARGQANLMRAAFADIPASEYIDPGDVLLWAVTVSARQVAWLRGIIADRLKAGTTVDGDALGPLVKLEQEERLHLARAAKMAIDAGIAERQVRVAERVAEQLVAVLRGVVTELGHDANDPAVQGVVRRHLQLMAGPSAA